MPDEYYGPELSKDLEQTWVVFLEINSGRQGKSTISFSEIKNYCELTGQYLYSWQIDAIKALDLVFMESAKWRT